MIEKFEMLNQLNDEISATNTAESSPLYLLIKYINRAFNLNCSSMKGIEKELSKIFCKKLKEYDDAEKAFSDLNACGLLYDFVYLLSDGGMWTVNVKPLPEKARKQILTYFPECNASVLEDKLKQVFTDRVVDCMNAVGCDARNAYRMEIEKLNGFSGMSWKKYIIFELPKGNPCVQFLA